jgi:hypothetical protein
MVCAIAAESLSAPPVPPSPLARDEEFVVRFSGKASISKVTGGGLTISTPFGPGVATAQGRYVAGHPLIDPVTGRAVVVRPEALREYFVLSQGLTVADADVQAERTLAKVEKTGNLAPLDAIDASLRQSLGAFAGTRLDDPSVLAFTPPIVAQDSPFAGLRRLIAGDDDLWRNYATGGDVNAFAQLAQTPGFERFYHPVDPETGIASADSLLRQREHRRLLVRRTRNEITFLPEIPIRDDLGDVSYTAGATYSVTAAGSLRRTAKELRPARGGVARFVKGVANFLVSSDPGDGGVFLGGTPRAGAAPADPPRIVNMTPPVGEALVDVTTDWEDPDNQFTVPIPQRKYFVVRLRFSKPLDPRTVDPAHFMLTTVVGGSSVPVGTFLSQRRTGEVVVEIQPISNLNPGTAYRVQVLGTVKALDGTTLGTDFVADL